MTARMVAEKIAKAGFTGTNELTDGGFYLSNSAIDRAEIALGKDVVRKMIMSNEYVETDKGVVVYDLVAS